MIDSVQIGHALTAMAVACVFVGPVLLVMVVGWVVESYSERKKPGA